MPPLECFVAFCHTLRDIVMISKTQNSYMDDEPTEISTPRLLQRSHRRGDIR
jgi:hypothetical protein